MSDLDHSTRVRFSVPQLATVIVAIIAGTWVVGTQLHSLTDRLARLEERLGQNGTHWTNREYDMAIWLMVKKNPALNLNVPYSGEVRAALTNP
jgi:hypothetical protein